MTLTSKQFMLIVTACEELEKHSNQSFSKIVDDKYATEGLRVALVNQNKDLQDIVKSIKESILNQENDFGLKEIKKYSVVERK